MHLKKIQQRMIAASMLFLCGGLAFAENNVGKESAQANRDAVKTKPKVDKMMETNVFNVREFGAVGDGVTDDTAAFQAAIKAASSVEGRVFVPSGRYAVAEIRLTPRIEFCGVSCFNYRRSAGSVLVLSPDAAEAKCLLNLTGAFGCHVFGLCLIGRGADEAEKVHGIMIDKPDYGKEEDTPAIDDCRIEKFSGDGIHLERIWCFSVRHSHCIGNGGCGLRVRGWDGFIIDNWFSANHEAGYGAYEENASVTMTGNRIEWNYQGGIVVKRGCKYNITGNYIDRSGHAGITLENSSDFAVTGNVIYRSGRPEWTPDEAESAHFILNDCSGITFTGNSLAIGRDDGGKGKFSPLAGMRIGNAQNCVVSNNTLHRASLKDLVILTGTQTNCVIKDNPGSLAEEK